MFRTTRTRNNIRRTQLGIQALEAREVPAILGGDIGGRPPVPEVPDYAGSTAETARVMNLPVMQVRTAADFLPASADIDMYKVTLKQGDYLIADADATGGVALNSTMQLLDAAGNQIAVSATRVGRPTVGVSTHESSLGAYAPADGTYYLKVTTSATTFDSHRAYNLSLERIALDDSNMSAAPLNGTGAFHAWLNATGDTLYMTGPTGYGFSLRGNWTKTVSGSAVTYAVTGTIYLRTPFLAQTAGEIGLQVAAGQSFKVTTNVTGPIQAGELTGVTGKFGLSLAPVADKVRQMFGLDVSTIALANGWTIKTGAQIKQAYQSYIQNDIAQLLDGVPYLVYGQAGKMKLQFGQVNVTTTDQAKTVLIADPADPFLYIGYKSYAAAGSLNGHIPFHTQIAPPSDSGLHTAQGESFGHVYAAGTYPLADLPMYAYGDVTVDLDANRDGMFLGGSGNASQLFHGDLKALDAVARDINVGINGGVNFGYAVAGRMITVPLGQGSAFYSGPQQGVWFKGVQGTAFNPWAGTVLANFQSGPGTEVEGYVFRDGRFSVATTSNYRLFSMNAALTLTVTNNEIGAKGSLSTPFGKTDVSGTIGFDGNFHWVAPAGIDIGGSSNHLRGIATMTIDKIGSVFALTADLDVDVKLSIPGFKITGKVGGILKMIRQANGSVFYSGSPKVTDGAMYVWNAIGQKWNKLGSLDNVGFGLSGNKLTLKAFGHTFSMNLPV